MGKPERRRLEHLTQPEIAPLEKMFAPGYPERLLDMARVLFVELLNNGQGPDDAAQLAHSLTEAVRQELGGRGLYVNKGVHFEADQRARQIAAEFTGNNIAQLGAKWGLSDERIRQIVKEVKQAREAEFMARQSALELGDARP